MDVQGGCFSAVGSVALKPLDPSLCSPACSPVGRLLLAGKVVDSGFITDFAENSFLLLLEMG